MPVAWHPSRWWDWCMSEDEKKKKKIKSLLKSYESVSVVGVLAHFGSEHCV